MKLENNILTIQETVDTSTLRLSKSGKSKIVTFLTGWVNAVKVSLTVVTSLDEVKSVEFSNPLFNFKLEGNKITLTATLKELGQSSSGKSILMTSGKWQWFNGYGVQLQAYKPL